MDTKRRPSPDKKLPLGHFATAHHNDQPVSSTGKIRRTMRRRVQPDSKISSALADSATQNVTPAFHEMHAQVETL